MREGCHVTLNKVSVPPFVPFLDVDARAIHSLEMSYSSFLEHALSFRLVMWQPSAWDLRPTRGASKGWLRAAT